SVKLVPKLLGAWADSATVRSLPESLLTEIVYSYDDFGVPISEGSFAFMVSLAGASVPMVSVTGRLIDCVPPLALTVMVCEPGLASFGTSTRSCRLVLSLMPGIAAATGWPPPRISAFQPFGTPSTDSVSDSGASPAFCSLKRTLATSPGRTVCDG